jgi:hypothetical protein
MYSGVSKYKNKIKLFSTIDESMQERIKAYNENLENSSYEKIMIPILELDISDTAFEYDGSLSKDKEEKIADFLINGGMQFAIPITKDKKVLRNSNKIKSLKLAIKKGLIPKTSKVLCYIFKKSEVNITGKSFKIIIPKYYYELLFFKDFFLPILSKKQDTTEIKIKSEKFDFKDKFIVIEKQSIEVLETYPYMTDEFLFYLYESGQLNKKKFPINKYLK